MSHIVVVFPSMFFIFFIHLQPFPSQSCVFMVSTLGGSWLEANLSSFLSLLMELVSQSKATHTSGDAAVTRCCVSFILRSTLGSLLGEKAQTNAVKQLCVTVASQTASGEWRCVCSQLDFNGNTENVQLNQLNEFCCVSPLHERFLECASM